MGVKGDLVAYMTAHNGEDARKMLIGLLDAAAAPDFAYKYADLEEERHSDYHNKLMVDYWRVINFLKSTV